MSETKRVYKDSAAPLWFKGKGDFMLSLDINEEVLDRIMSQAEVGGKVKIRFLKEESKKSDKSPDAYLEFTSREDNEAYKAGRTQR